MTVQSVRQRRDSEHERLAESDEQAVLGELPGAGRSSYAQNVSPVSTAAPMIVESKGGFGGASPAFGADSGVNPGDPDAIVWSQPALVANDTG